MEDLPNGAGNMQLTGVLRFYQTWPDLLDNVQTIAFTEGYAVRIERSRRKAAENHPAGAKYLRYDVSCVFSGSPPPLNENRRRAEQASFKTNCPFEIRAIWRAKEGLWELERTCIEHNHPPHERPQDLCAHRRHFRRQEASFEQQVEILSQNGKKTCTQIAEELQSIFRNLHLDKTIEITSRDVQNAQDIITRRKYGPYTSTQLFLETLELQPEVVHHAIDRGEDGRIAAP